ncbi:MULTISPECIES: winged helix DNA-binding protein [unclassified Methanoregula]|uniref:winged helix DNA-binding protein n=1 Tax=unclassified Methanoregula TaxID=2649730 RepID=UPI0009CB89C6|nr:MULTISPECIES: winged helix DNA-binding protein [unclassified Methanoregula]OPX65541.1 MAG: hypothetical protein A4E33_00083 [Methanoregula sp. PtaB.Bin085]OPY35821.1 MAG: hypothetical protein A4E34_00498 [Methanoregula sp. PtaU1.Bin006]
MPTGSHVHIISAGKDIHLAYPATFRTLPSISRTCVIADEEVYGISQNPEIGKQRQAVRNAVSSVKEISASLSIPFSYEIVHHPVYPSVRSILTKIHRENLKARFTFDVTGGSKELCLALMSFAPWVGGEVFSSFDEKTLRSVPLPDRSVRTMMQNPNYQTILAVLLRKNRKGELTWFSRSYLFSQVWPYYQRMRTRKPKAGDRVIQYRNGRKPANNLSQATFSSFMAHLRSVGFIEEQQDEKNRKEKAYRITEPGETAFRFFADPATSSDVKTILERP